MSKDPWKHRGAGMRCRTCMWFVIKVTTDDSGKLEPSNKNGRLGRCRRHAPSPNGFLPVFENDWCGDHRLDENKI